MAAADVHATCESQPAIDHKNLAVVAEIGIVQPARNQRRQKGVEVNFVPAEKLLDGGKRIASANVVDEHANSDPAVLRSSKRFNELPPGRIVVEDVRHEAN